MERAQRALQTEFCSNDPRTPRSFLGIQFGYHTDGPESIHQCQYNQKMLFNFGIEKYQPKSSPMNPKQILDHSPDEEPADEEAKARFATALGLLMSG